MSVNHLSHPVCAPQQRVPVLDDRQRQFVHFGVSHGSPDFAVDKVFHILHLSSPAFG
jgi:hypothetical protein